MLPEPAIPVEATDGHPKACLAFIPKRGIFFNQPEVILEGGTPETLHVPTDPLLDPLPNLAKPCPRSVQKLEQSLEFFVTEHCPSHLYQFAKLDQFVKSDEDTARITLVP